MDTITVKRELDFNDLMEECWSGAIDTLKTIQENDKENEFMSFLSLDWGGDLPDLGEVNDFLWFEDDYIFDILGIKTDDDDDEEEEDDD